MKSNPPGRSPAEKAFDFLIFPSLLNAVLLIAACVLHVIGTENESITPPAFLVRSLQAGGVLSLLHWLIGLGKVRKSWHDPFGKVLRYSSAGILAMQSLVIAEAFGLRVIARVVAFFTA